MRITNPAIRQSASAAASRVLFGHPAGLGVLFLSAMWEIFALFGMRAVLVYYLVDQLRFSPQSAVEVYGLSTAAAFFTALLGGLLADRYIGARRAAIAGALLMAAGQFLLVQPSLLYAGLTLIALGNGLYKPTMLAQVGLLYANEDPRRERAYNIYAVGCNFGAVISPLICGAIGAAYGWNRAFLVSGSGMILSAAIFYFGRHYLAPSHPVPRVAETTTQNTSATAPLAVLCVAWVAGVFFWAAYGQIGGTVALWAQDDVDRALRFGAHAVTVPAAWFQSVNPLLIFLLAPCVNWLWARDRSPVGVRRDLRKMTIGAVQLAVCFAIMAAAAAYGGTSVSPVWLLLALVPFTLGEIYLNNIGQALFSRVAPARYVSVFMGIWILTLMLGHAAAGWLGRAWTGLSTQAFFSLVAAIALAGAAILAIARPILFGTGARSARVIEPS